MNKFIKQIIDENFKNKKFKKYSYTKGGSDTLLKKIKKKSVSKKEEDVEEIVDDKGNFIKGKKPTDFNTKGITSNSTSDEYAKTAGGQMGGFAGTYGTSNGYRRFWGESDMSGALGYEDTLGQDEGYEEAKRHFKEDLGLDDIEAEERLAQMGYDKKLPDDMVRLVENPKQFVNDYLESILSKKTSSSDLVKNGVEKEVNPIIIKQIQSLKSTLNSNDLSINDILKYFNDNE